MGTMDTMDKHSGKHRPQIEDRECHDPTPTKQNKYREDRQAIVQMNTGQHRFVHNWRKLPE